MRSRWVLPVVLLLAAPLAAEEPVRNRFLLLRHEEIKPGLGPDHDTNAAQYQALQRQIGAGNHWIGLRPVAADDNTLLYLEPYATLADLEKAQRDVDAAVASSAAYRTQMAAIAKHADVHASQRSMLFRARLDMSIDPLPYAEVARSRYLTAMWVKTRPGRGDDYVQWLKELNEGRRKAQAGHHFTVYQSMFGASTGTFLFLTVWKDLKSYGEWLAGGEQREAAVAAALGGEAAQKERRVRYSEVVADATVYLYAMAPEMSRPTDQWIAWDPAFWKPPAASTKLTAAKKDPKKP